MALITKLLTMLQIIQNIKWKYTPLTRIPILSDEEVFQKYEEVYALILSWNISDILKDKLLVINSKNSIFKPLI